MALKKRSQADTKKKEAAAKRRAKARKLGKLALVAGIARARRKRAAARRAA
jgi:hypothetical protein